ncbi:hypothetical protein D3C79_1085330 [compost metagenome]
MRIRRRSCTAAPYPKPTMGPISGEISMAPMITAVEFVLSPTEAIRMAKNSTQRLVPPNCTPDRIVSSMTDASC